MQWVGGLQGKDGRQSNPGGQSLIAALALTSSGKLRRIELVKPNQIRGYTRFNQPYKILYQPSFCSVNLPLPLPTYGEKLVLQCPVPVCSDQQRVAVLIFKNGEILRRLLFIPILFR